MKKQAYETPEMAVMQTLKSLDVICTSINYGGVITDPSVPGYNPEDFD